MANGEGIKDAVELEQRLTRIESQGDEIIRRLDSYIGTHQDWALREIERNDEHKAKMEARLLRAETNVSELKTSQASHGTLWEQHAIEHEAMGRKERTWDAIVGIGAVLTGIFSNTLR